MISGYGDSEVIHSISLEVKAKEVVAVLGPNGAGKTTLLKTIIGLVKATRGSIRLEHDQIREFSTKKIMKLGVGYVPQGRSIVPQMSVKDNLVMGAYLLTDKRLVEKRLPEMFELFPILHQRKDENAGVLSGGERQMMVIARALMLSPKILLLDEPSLGLDPKFLSLLYQKVEQLNEDGTAILLVEQNVKKALGIADRVYVMETGRIRLEGTSEELVSEEKIKDIYLGGAARE